ncbi:MAG: dTDP-4-dehydrorhamnose 3,5-epimerase [Spirochaetota bacterium]|nr:dTDP-4-dehydrorhamnose 3,5-epimerase [Spirochaetota bacterium]HPM43277.1 dTDP-4-dehydrorhamnose 3,5-epimerase [Candidatus Omnitrophota bacterium]HPV99402.1 dTDP-4-dehydrorhamnose 3,5-epimerase [Spirochaetota bacterium]
MPSAFKKLEIEGLILVEPVAFHDERGFFLESFKESEFAAAGITERFVQDNHSLSARNVIRGLHYQKEPSAQGKLVRVIKGRAWDVAVDLRPGSLSFGKWLGMELSEENRLMLYIPPGFAHGFAALSDEVHLLYKCTREYDPALDAGIRWDDPDLAVKWPVENPILSSKDRNLPLLRDIIES